MLKIYCDGACSGNPGPGAWAYAVFQCDDLIATASAAYHNTTNNRMELLAAINAMQVFDDCVIILDSKYVQEGINLWLAKWRVNGWRTAQGPVKNLDLWQIADHSLINKKIKFEWQKGHSHSLHDVADSLARASVLK